MTNVILMEVIQGSQDLVHDPFRLSLLQMKLTINIIVQTLVSIGHDQVDAISIL